MNWSNHWCTWSLDRYARSTSVICHSSCRVRSRIQLLHDAAQIGKQVTDGTAKLGLTLFCKSTLLANEKRIVGHLEAEGVPICQGAAATELGDRNCSWEKKMRVKPMETHLERQANGEESQPPMQDEPGCAKARADGNSSCSTLRSHCTGSVHRTGQRDVQTFYNG